MILLKGITARIGHEQMAVVERDTLRLVADLHGIGHAVVCQVDFSHETVNKAAR